mmetsp:Transcript_2807/g.9081  ORF Transcript_2807/g.9081 Transcript_2807/m.9081 type:complete len:262 (-) Transcript_2807:1352-2137(-)
MPPSTAFSVAPRASATSSSSQPSSRSAPGNAGVFASWSGSEASTGPGPTTDTARDTIESACRPPTPRSRPARAATMATSLGTSAAPSTATARRITSKRSTAVDRSTLATSASANARQMAPSGSGKASGSPPACMALSSAPSRSTNALSDTTRTSASATARAAPPALRRDRMAARRRTTTGSAAAADWATSGNVFHAPATPAAAPARAAFGSIANAWRDSEASKVVVELRAVAYVPRRPLVSEDTAKDSSTLSNSVTKELTA